MTLTIYNTLTRQKEPFEPLEPGKVRMYCCGITVYDYCHLGHARTCLVWDVVRRYLQWRGYQVQYIQNFTDIDDKILNRARKEGTSMEDVSERFIKAYFEDMDRLHIQKADAYPRATHTLDGIKRLVYELEQKGYAYPADGDVYYSVRSFSDYGKLSGRKLEDLQAGASGRVDLEDSESQKKKDPFDFALWKAAKPGEPSWESPWGLGRPGWHIECSAMVRERLGETIDIHVGGSDLIFPHHENEIAQSEAATGKPLARYWMHNGMVKVGGEKMSKSLGNFTTIRDLLAQFDPMAVRLFILQTHYRNPLDFTPKALEAATNGWQTLQEGLLFGYLFGEKLGWDQLSSNSSVREDNPLVQQFQDAVDDDFNFAGGLAVLFEIAKDLRKEGNILVHQEKTETSPEKLKEQWQTLVQLSQVLGLEAHPPQVHRETTDGLTDAEIETLIEQRTQARKAKNFAEGDRIRDDLKAKGITLIDQSGGITKWHRS
ncbi:cysteinyl-tRNA synthetase [Gloeothece citriformis PCC 7424]|uniref:Cysteine--tRNA ligase n=1 Tax=Gloeothece citriformis (strain PCC 7424) TaxID=65393 RepID=SYC_GLOC7|nr:cysteine--tRNA ligase [Gloeothece citriformis]B7K7T8.1 RecName: Full=Cysteine--tRNA ligase; AltName: Full=Cysteinyl-tRNA synthetase; Short=CysRS [Gloeothece citriformis PCC 7424]ACK71134.1 cysteinyl-tRNA synthetase [Gloeothece citriformis PCC 7424]